jgi:ribosomal protein L13
MHTPTQLSTSVPRLWHIVDAKNQIVGRLAPQVARLLAGKHKPTFLPHVDSGDFVVVTNAANAVLSGDKMRTKLYRWHTQYPGGLRSLTARQLQVRARAARSVVLCATDWLGGGPPLLPHFFPASLPPFSLPPPGPRARASD